MSLTTNEGNDDNIDLVNGRVIAEADAKQKKKADDEAAEAALLVLGKNSKINPTSEFICEYLMRVSPFSPKTLLQKMTILVL